MAGWSHQEGTRSYDEKCYCYAFCRHDRGKKTVRISGRKSDTGFITHVYVTTEYGKEIILELSENIYKEKLHIHVGRLDEEAMQRNLHI